MRGALITFAGDPFADGIATARRYEPDAIVAIEDGRIRDCGPAAEVSRRLPADVPVTAYANALITAGFVDAHVHYPQLPIIGAGGKPLLDWLATYTYPAEERYADADYARAVARVYLRENLRNGITTAAVFGTVHAASVDALFEEADAEGLRLVAGKVLMDRNAPAALRDTAQRGYDESKRLIARWHGRGRLAYAITPRFAVTSTPAQLEAAGALKREHPDAYVQSHLSENRAEIARVAELFPGAASYLDVYAQARLDRRRARSTATASTWTRRTSARCTKREPRSLIARRRTTSSAADSSGSPSPPTRGGPFASGSRRTSAAGPASRCCGRCRPRAKLHRWPARRCRRPARSISPPAAPRARSTSKIASAPSRRAWKRT